MCGAATCGSDGCGGTCGSCAAGQFCLAGSCVTPICGNGTCQPGETATSCPYDCICKPNCTGKGCGPDGCGGLCGTCNDASFCTDVGTCVPKMPCQDVGSEGCCSGKAWATCTQDKGLIVIDCAANGGLTCGWNASAGAYGCIANCTNCADPSGKYPLSCCKPSCVGKMCGSDGCDGWCGSCPPGSSCADNGICMSD